jgi:short-subunit dehydrogenase
MSSLASFRGFAGAPAYCASKAAVRNYGEGLRNAYARDGIGVSVICPGFVRSGMTDENDFAMPFLMDAERAARIIRRGLARNRGRIAFPWQMYGAAWLVQALPTWTTDRVMRGLPAKASD